VKAGEVVGTVGGSGYGKDKNYGPHLHLELYKNGVVIDPTPYLSSSW
jgi:murein DD-endopeptidase MepM/ murein hydrolase activator NlpD